nr:YtxH domain-containing protein [uncultured Draconibacterium sp.]
MSKTTNVLVGFIAGAAAGTITGILVAPDKGVKTRKKINKQIKRTSRDVSESIGDVVEEMKEKLNEVVSEMRSKVNETEEKIKEKVNSKSKTAEDAAAN